MSPPGRPKGEFLRAQPEGTPVSPAPLALLDAWQARGWLRALDVAFARFVLEHAGEAPLPELPLAAALLAHLEGQGHTCLPLEALARGELLLLPSEFADAVREPTHAADQWADRLRACRVVDPLGSGTAPIVLADGRLYLRRHWRDERSLVAALLERTPSPSREDGRGEGRPALAWGDVSADTVRSLLDGLFGPPGAETDWQRQACAIALRGRLTVLTGGPGTGKTYTAARLLALLLATAERPAPLRIGLAAPTGKAAARLAQSIRTAWSGLAAGLGDRLPLADWARHIGPARTLHAWLGARPDTRRWAHDAHHPLALDVLLVDEASMVHLELMAALLRALPPQAMLVLLGDKDQLASVEAGAVLGDLCRGAEAGGYSVATASDLARLTGQPLPPAMVQTAGHSPLAQQTVMLRVSRRFGGAIGQLARHVQAGEGAPALALLRSAPAGSGLHLLEATGQASLLEDLPPLPLRERLVARALDGAIGDDGQPIPGYRAVCEALQRGLQQGWPDAEGHAAWVREVLTLFDQTRLLAALRSGPWGVEGLNDAVQAALAEARCLRPDGAAGWYPGRPVIVTRNDASVGVYNGDVGLALPAFGASRSESLRVWFLEGDTLRSVLASRLASVETAFAMTVHKSQGSEFAHTLLVLPEHDNPVLTRELVYTGITRARRALTVALPQGAVWPAAVARRTRRASGLEGALVRHDPALWEWLQPR